MPDFTTTTWLTSAHLFLGRCNLTQCTVSQSFPHVCPHIGECRIMSNEVSMQYLLSGVMRPKASRLHCDYFYLRQLDTVMVLCFPLTISPLSAMPYLNALDRWRNQSLCVCKYTSVDGIRPERSRLLTHLAAAPGQFVLKYTRVRLPQDTPPKSRLTASP